MKVSNSHIMDIMQSIDIHIKIVRKFEWKKEKYSYICKILKLSELSWDESRKIIFVVHSACCVSSCSTVRGPFVISGLTARGAIIKYSFSVCVSRFLFLPTRLQLGLSKYLTRLQTPILRRLLAAQTTMHTSVERAERTSELWMPLMPVGPNRAQNRASAFLLFLTIELPRWFC